MNSRTSSDNRAAWLREASPGLMFHYIDNPASSTVASATTPAEWNQRVDSFNVPRFARLVRETGAGYIIFTLGQNSGHYCSPNAVYDELTRQQPSRLSHRDLVAEIADALAPDVKLIAYLPSHAPSNHPEAVNALRYLPPWDASLCSLTRFWPESSNADDRLTVFQRNWEAVIAHWGERWGEAVAGWWIDGCYFADRIYKSATPEEIAGGAPCEATLAAALRTGNPDRILAFCAGTARAFERVIAGQDYTAGEFSNRLPVSNKWHPLTATTDGMQTHLLGYLGDWWGEGQPRFTDDFVRAYTRHVGDAGAALTWDIPVTRDGDIPSAFLRQIETITSHV
ncbi:hypothetical protein OPIT5_26900 [Opitutaceae bacterium TAV5]|nr:hypothetical protein OPIT5_26900 [Opitutaceae bacterium TAV5]